MRAEQRYPLPAEERARLLKTTLASEAIVLALGWMLAFLGALLHGAALPDALFGSWLADIAERFTLHPAMLAAPVLLVAAANALHALAWPRSASYRAAVLSVRQGVNGELMRLEMPAIVVLMCVGAFAEEFAFRFGLLGLLVPLLAGVVPAFPAGVTAVVAGAAGFAVIHSQYRDPWSLGSVFVIGIVLGAVYLWTGSLLAVWCAHAIYNIGDMLVERRRIVRQDDYFGGKVPVNVIGELSGGSGRPR